MTGYEIEPHQTPEDYAAILRKHLVEEGGKLATAKALAELKEARSRCDMLLDCALELEVEHLLNQPVQ